MFPLGFWFPQQGSNDIFDALQLTGNPISQLELGGTGLWRGGLFGTLFYVFAHKGLFFIHGTAYLLLVRSPFWSSN